jgi:tetratricopeptide (TPR) repeat protein
VSETAPDFWAFLSYSSHDRAAAIWIQRSLETYRVPQRLLGRMTPAGPAPRRFRPIFRDRTELAADPDLTAQITSALRKSAYLIVLCSPHAASSHWVDEEITLFRSLHDSSRILSVILDGSPENEHEGCFPPALRYRSIASAPRRAEPIAADLRTGGDGRHMVRLKLVAGMLGVGLDELVRRDAQRRNRQLVAVTTASLGGLAVMAILAAAAVIGRNEAQRQRAQAEGLIEFMLTDLRKKLEPGGRLDAMDGVSSEALRYYSAQKPADLDAQSLGRRARALRLMGEITLQRGDLSDALIDFEQAAATTAELLERSPEDGQIIFNQAQNVFWVGEIARQRGNIAKSEVSFRSYLDLARRLTRIDPRNDDWWAEVAYAESALGVLFLQEGRAPEAYDAFALSLGVVEGLSHRKPDDPSLQVELGQGHAWLADALQKQGRLAETRSHAETELKIYRAILAKDPTIRQAKFSTIDALQTIGRLAALQGNKEAALEAFNESSQRAEALLDGERDNMDSVAVAALTHVTTGETFLASGSLDPARAAQRRADELLKAVLAHDSGVALWRNYRDRADLLAAAIAAASGEPDRALLLDRAVLARLDKPESAKPNTEAFWLLSRALLQTGDDLAALRRSAEAKEQWNVVIKNLSGPIENYEPRLIEVLASAEWRLGRTADAQLATKRLQSLFQPGSKPIVSL